MSSRMDKYYKEKEDKTESRTSRHQGIYTKVDDDDYEKLNLSSNVSVIKMNSNLDIDSIKELIEEKYEKRTDRKIDTENLEDDVPYEEDDFEEDTKEYDLKKVIETAHKNKTPNYDRERFEHLRETQYDILNSLNIDRLSEPIEEETLSEEEATLINLIKTVNENAERNQANKSDDLLDDLMGGDHTEVLEPVTIEEAPDKKPTILEELEKTKQLSRKEIDTELEKLTENVSEPFDDEDESDDETSENRITLSKTEELSNSFYTGNYQIKDKDMDDFMDLEKEMSGGGLVVKILIIIIVLITIAIAVYLLNKYLNLGLF